LIHKIRLTNFSFIQFFMNLDLQGKRVLVTAGAAGIGKAIVETFLAEGARVVVGQRDFSKLQPLLDQYTPQLAGFAVDVSSAEECETLVRNAIGVLGGLDILVNNAAVTGAPAARWFLDETPEHIDTVLDTNLKGVIHCSLHAARQMRVQETGGAIIHISSVGAFGAQQTASLYCASKAALTGLTQSMGLELASQNIRVVAVAPGDIRIEKSGDVAATQENLKIDPRFVPSTPLGYGEPDDIGSVVAFLASHHAKFVTGTTVIVDGGWLSY
jgi:NAD(P)-dependent dehydrogenase (short-subunit alcohol dehydrogenase family)